MRFPGHETVSIGNRVRVNDALVSHRKCKHFAILWPFMLAALLEMFYRIPQKDTGKLKSFLWQQKERK